MSFLFNVLSSAGAMCRSWGWKPLKTNDLINIAWIYHRNYFCYHLVGPINLNIFVIMLMMVWKNFLSTTGMFGVHFWGEEL